MKTITISTQKKDQIIDITEEIQEEVGKDNAYCTCEKWRTCVGNMAEDNSGRT